MLQWESNKDYTTWVYFCSPRYPACNAHAPYFHLWPVPLYKTFSVLSHKRHDCGKKSLSKKCVFWYPLQRLSQAFFTLRRTERDMIKNVYVLLAVYPNTIVFFYQLDAQILYFHTFITFLYMFRALLCSSSGGHRLREDSRNLCTERSPKQSDDTRCCVNTIVLLKMSTIVLETCRGM